MTGTSSAGPGLPTDRSGTSVRPSVSVRQDHPGTARTGFLRTALAGLALLRERAWGRALLGVVVLSIVFLLLGRWQYHRHEERTARNDLVAANYATPAAPLARVLPSVGRDPGRTLPRELEWRAVTVRGEYLPERTVLLRNRPHQQQNGYDVVVPFRTAEGPILLVDRGWIPAGSRSAAAPDDVPAPPSGEVTVTARLRRPEPAGTRQAPPGQANRIAVPQLAQALGAADAPRVVGAYGLLEDERPAAGSRPVPAARPDPGLGINLAYAVQWAAFAVVAYVMLGVAMVREVRRRRGEVPRPLRMPWRVRERDEFDED